MTDQLESNTVVDDLLKRVAESPSNVAAWQKIGLLLLKQKKPQRAIELLDQACSKNPQSVETATTLAMAYVHAGDSKAAIEWYRKALEPDPTNVDTLRQLAVLSEKRHDLEQARSYSDAILAVKPRDALAVVIKGRVIRRSSQAETALEFLEAAEPVEGEQRDIAAYWVERGRCLDTLGRFDDAFSCFSKGQTIDADKRPDVVDHITNTTKLLLREWNALTALKNRPSTYAPAPHFGTSPVFLVGFPRSGTTLLDSILDSHPSLSVLSEQSQIESIHRFLLKNDKDNDVNGPDGFELVESLRADYWSHVEQHTGTRPKNILIDKLPLNLLFIRTIHFLFPSAKIVMAVRHPCDACLSNFFQPFLLNLFMANFLTLEDAAKFYDSCMSHWQLAQQVLPLKVHTVRYEDVLEDFNATIGGLLEFLDVPWDDSVVTYHQHAAQRIIFTPSYEQVIKPIYQESRYRWHNYKHHMQSVLPTLHRHIAAFGYPDPYTDGQTLSESAR